MLRSAILQGYHHQRSPDIFALVSEDPHQLFLFQRYAFTVFQEYLEGFGMSPNDVFSSSNIGRKSEVHKLRYTMSISQRGGIQSVNFGDESSSERAGEKRRVSEDADVL
jgi:hypothetical protein